MEEEKGLELLPELTQEQFEMIARRFKVLVNKNNPWFLKTLEWLCDYNYFHLKRSESSIDIIFLK